jgi:hypothetical protein
MLKRDLTGDGSIACPEDVDHASIELMLVCLAEGTGEQSVIVGLKGCGGQEHISSFMPCRSTHVSSKAQHPWYRVPVFRRAAISRQ